jgi:hypothetical protein
MQIMFDNSLLSSPGVWLTSVPPHELNMLGAPTVSRGNTSVLLVKGPSFDEEKEQLTVLAEGLTLLNLGTTNRTLVVDAELQDLASALEASGRTQGPGDREYRSLVDVHLKGEAREVAHELLTKIRETRPGDLKRGERNNFSNTPDNFWYVIVQPRTQCLSITVRGEPDRFGPSSLQLVTDRPGYTRFQLRSSSDLEEALRIIHGAKRSMFGESIRRRA